MPEPAEAQIDRELAAGTREADAEEIDRKPAAGPSDAIEQEVERKAAADALGAGETETDRELAAGAREADAEESEPGIAAGAGEVVEKKIPSVASEPPEREEIERRRQLVRTLFNDFWSGRFDKPAAFVDRLNEAETYLNERLSASGEGWQLDAGTRKLLGLPPRASPRDRASRSAQR